MNTYKYNTNQILLTVSLIALMSTACTSQSTDNAAISQKEVNNWIHQLNNEVKSDLSLAQVEAQFQKYLRGNNKELSAALAKHLMQVAKEQHLSPSVILAVIKAESTFKVRAKSKVGALGLMQIKPSTAKYIAQKRGLSVYRKANDLYDPFINITLGVHYLSYLRGKFDNSLHYVAAYNLGPTSVRRMVNKNQFALGKVEKYVREIHSDARKLRRTGGSTDSYLSYNH